MIQRVREGERCQHFDIFVHRSVGAGERYNMWTVVGDRFEFPRQPSPIKDHIYLDLGRLLEHVSDRLLVDVKSI